MTGTEPRAHAPAAAGHGVGAAVVGVWGTLNRVGMYQSRV